MDSWAVFILHFSAHLWSKWFPLQVCIHPFTLSFKPQRRTHRTQHAHSEEPITQVHASKTQLFWDLVSRSRTLFSRTNLPLLSNDGTLCDEDSNRKVSNEKECFFACGIMSESLNIDVVWDFHSCPVILCPTSLCLYDSSSPPPPPQTHTQTLLCPCIPRGPWQWGL